MTTRQILLKALYPLIMLRNKLFPHDKSIQQNQRSKEPPVSFYSLETKANNGGDIHFSDFRGKKVLLVNTASNCGFTGQYAELEELHQRFPQELVVIGFPANDFKQQEQLDDAGIAEFCKVNYGVSFPLAKKSQVIDGDRQNPVFNWLTHAKQNGWSNQQPLWNFNKYLVDEEGRLAAFFAHTISPLHPEMIALIEKTPA
jgi:glutathione peroxidase